MKIPIEGGLSPEIVSITCDLFGGVPLVRTVDGQQMVANEGNSVKFQNEYDDQPKGCALAQSLYGRKLAGFVACQDCLWADVSKRTLAETA